MSDWGTVQMVVIGVLTVVTTITTALVGIQIGTVKTLRESNNDLRNRVVDLENERTADKAKIAAGDAQVAEKASENKMLKTMLTGKVEWMSLTDQLTEFHRQALARWAKMEGLLESILEAVTEK